MMSWWNTQCKWSLRVSKTVSILNNNRIMTISRILNSTKTH